MLKKTLSVILALAVIILSLGPVSANAAVESTTALTDYANLEENFSGNEDCDVEVARGTSFIVVIPKLIVLDGNSGDGSYTVTVDADLAGTEYISVVPTPGEGGYVLREAGGKRDISYSVNQPQTVFIANGSVSTALDGEMELAVPTIIDILDEAQNVIGAKKMVGGYEVTRAEAAVVNASVSAPDVSAGKWSGTFIFDISLNTK